MRDSSSVETGVNYDSTNIFPDIFLKILRCSYGRQSWKNWSFIFRLEKFFCTSC